jgi:hypothetical protein
MEIDRQELIQSLGGEAAVAKMTHEQRADALEDFQIEKLDAETRGAQKGREIPNRRRAGGPDRNAYLAARLRQAVSPRRPDGALRGERRPPAGEAIAEDAAEPELLRASSNGTRLSCAMMLNAANDAGEDRAARRLSRFRQGRRHLRPDLLGPQQRNLPVQAGPPIRAIHRSDGWTPEKLDAQLKGAFGPSCTPLERSADVFAWDSI